jgi:hypothetical protein
MSSRHTFSNNVQHGIILPADLADFSSAAHRVQVHCSRVTACHAHLHRHEPEIQPGPWILVNKIKGCPCIVLVM